MIRSKATFNQIPKVLSLSFDSCVILQKSCINMSGFVFLPKTPSSNSNTLSTVVSSPSPHAISAALPFKEPKMASFRSPSG